MLKVVEVVKSCWATVAHPGQGRGEGYGGVNNFTYKSRRLLFHAGVESKSNTETGPLDTRLLRQVIQISTNATDLSFKFLTLRLN